MSLHPLQVLSFRDIIGAPRLTASTKDSTLIIIDAQNEYADGHLKTPNVEYTRRSISELLEAYRSSGAPPGNIVHVTHQTAAGAPIFTPGTRLAREFDELAPRPGEKTVAKRHPGSFTGTGLHEHLRGTGATKLVLAGYMAHVCVSSTARQAAERGYGVVLPREAIGDRGIPGVPAERLVETALYELGDCFGTVVWVADVLGLADREPTP